MSDDRGRICEIVSRMLDNPDEHGIYPTTRCYDELEALMRDRRLERDTLRTMVVEIYQVARRELYRLRALPAGDVTGKTLHEIDVLARFVKDAQEHVELIGQVESRVKTSEDSAP